eukprot:s7005_g3.t1
MRTRGALPPFPSSPTSSSVVLFLPEEELSGWNLDIKERSQRCHRMRRSTNQTKAEVVVDLDGEFLGVHKVVKEKDKGPKEDWWEFHESLGDFIRHHVAAKDRLFRPSSWNGCPVHPARLEPTRTTEVQYVGGGVEMETSDWHGPQSGSRKLPRPWTGRTSLKIPAAEEPEDEELMKRNENSWEKLIGDLTQPVELDTIYSVEVMQCLQFRKRS